MSGRGERTAKAAKNAKPRNLTTNHALSPTEGTPRHKRTGRVAGRESGVTAAELLKRATGLTPRPEAEYLLMHLLHVPRHGLYLGRAVSPRAAEGFGRLVARAQAGEPVQYLTKSAPFLDFEVHVDRRVLIPRPETEELVARTIARLRSGRKPPAVGRQPLIVDYGTGSGCIAIALARVVPEAKVLAVDTSKAALTVAEENVARCGLTGRVRLAEARTIDAPALARLRGRLDLFISNPPYIPTSRLAHLDRAVCREPRLALDGGPKGVNIVAMLLTRGPALLRPGGLLAIEIDATHEAIVRKLAPGAEIERDLAGRIRYAFLKK